MSVRGRATLAALACSVVLFAGIVFAGIAVWFGIPATEPPGLPPSLVHHIVETRLNLAMHSCRDARRAGVTWEALFDIRTRLARGGSATACDLYLIESASSELAWLHEVESDAIEFHDELSALEADLGDAAAFCLARSERDRAACLTALNRCEAGDE